MIRVFQAVIALRLRAESIQRIVIELVKLSVLAIEGFSRS